MKKNGSRCLPLKWTYQRSDDTAMLSSRLLSHTDIELLVERPQALEHTLEQDVLPLCTVVEPLLVADSALKGRGRLDWFTFRDGWQAVIDTRRLYVAPLDVDCLNRALFERSDEYIVTGLWPRVREHTPDRSVRRLILRPSEQTWWGDELYAEMESWHGEEQING